MLITLTIVLTWILVFFLCSLAVWLLIRKTLGVLRQSEFDAQHRHFMVLIPPILFIEPPAGSVEDAKRAWQRAVAPQIRKIHLSFQTGTARSIRIRREAARDVLEELSETLAGEVRHHLTHLFEQLGYVREQTELLTDRRWWIRGEAARRLGIIRSPQAVLPLVELLQDRERDVRLAASQSLLDIAGVKGALHQILQNLTSITPWMSVLLSKRIIAAGPASIGPLLAGLESPSASVRRFAIRMLGQLRAPEVIGPIYARFSAMDLESKILSLNTLGRCGDERVMELLLVNIGVDRLSLRIAAINAMGYLGSPLAIPTLKDQLLSPVVAVQRAASQALSLISPAGKEALADIASSSTGTAQALALESLDELSMVEERP
jgi:HEAT repeat protein